MISKQLPLYLMLTDGKLYGYFTEDLVRAEGRASGATAIYQLASSIPVVYVELQTAPVIGKPGSIITTKA